VTDKDWIKKVNELREFCASVGIPVGIEEDKSNDSRLDAQILFGDMPIEQFSEIRDITWSVIVQLKINKGKWEKLINKMQALTEKFAESSTFYFAGWSRIEDPSDLIMNGNVLLKSIVTNTSC